jgi:hypothetical protein
MNKLRERTLARRIVRKTGRNMKPFGYALTKPTFICREYPHLIAFFHFHKFTFGPQFRVHFGIRVLNSAFPAPALNGPMPSAGAYREDEQSVRDCIQKLTEMLIRDGLPWVESWLAPEKLISDTASPLSEDDKASLCSALKEGPDSEHLSLSYALLGIKSPNQALQLFSG